jgi:hypothetical protein
MVYKFEDFLNESSDSITFIDAAVLTLKENENKPMSAKEIWNYISKNNIISSKGKTPWITLNTVMSRFSKNTKLDLTLQNRNPDKIEIFEIVKRSPLMFILLDENYTETLVKTDTEIENYVQAQEEDKIDKIKVFAKNPFRQSICVLGESGSGKSVTIENILENEDHNFEFIIPTAATTGLLAQFSPSRSTYVPSRLGRILIESSNNPDKLYTAVFDEMHKSNVIEMINDELLQAISTKRNKGVRFISLDDDTSEIYSESNLETKRGNLLIPDNFGFIFISSKPRVISNNADFFNRVDVVILKEENRSINSSEKLLNLKISDEEKRKLSSSRND